jgi:hypothetical protein
MPVKFGLWRVDGESVEQVPTSAIGLPPVRATGQGFES